MADIPQKLGKYEIRRELGRGAMGIVCEGWDPMIARRVALKTVRREQLERTEAEEILSRFQREAQAAGRLNHPNVVAVYDFGEDPDGTAYIAMEYVEGRELKDYFDQQERFSLDEIVRLMQELLAALGHAHAHGIVHRDIKPANIFILASGQAKVGDFGIARIESSNLTQAGSVLGTPAYMSPEQFMGQRVDGRSDLFSAGVILYQFLTGEKPFSGQLTTIMHKVLKEDPILPSELNVQAPPAFDAVVRKAMAKRPEERFQTAQAFSAALQSALAEAGTMASDATLVAAGPDATVVAAAGDATVVHAAADTARTVVSAAPPPMPPTLGDVFAKTTGAPVETAQTPARAKTPVPRRSIIYPIAAVFGAILILGGLLTAYLVQSGGGGGTQTGSVSTGGMLPAKASREEASGLVTISAVAYVDPSDPRFKADPGLMRTTLREESRRELIEKAVALYVQPTSLAQNYAMLREKLFGRGNEFIESVMTEEAPQTGKDGLTSMVTRATVRVREVQKSLNQMSREERVDFIRNNGDPKITVVITTAGSADGAAPRRSPIAENVLKEKIQSFGFRTWAEEGGDKQADFAVFGEAKFKKLSVKLEASGLELERTVITSWTIRCIDKKTGEEVYLNTTIPQKVSWNSEDEALVDVGKLIGEEFSKSFFLQNFDFVGQKVRLNITGLPDEQFSRRLTSEISALRNVLTASSSRSGEIDVELSGGKVNLSDLVMAGIAEPLNRKFGRTCFNVAGASDSEVRLEFGAECRSPEVSARLDAAPPAALYEAPAVKRQSIVKNPDMLRKFDI